MKLDKCKNKQLYNNYLMIGNYMCIYLYVYRDGSAKMSYRVISHDGDQAPVTVSVSGVLTTYSRTGQATLHVTSQEEFGANQTLVLLIKVGCSL